MTYVAVLKSKRTEVLAEIDTLRLQATEIAGRIAAKEGQLRNLDDLLNLEDGEPQPHIGSTEPMPRVAATKSQRFTDAAVEILAEKGTPIHYLELVRMLSEREVYVPGKDPGANLIAHMLRDERFSRAGGRGMYGLASWPGMRPSTARTAKGRRSRRIRTTRQRSRAVV